MDDKMGQEWTLDVIRDLRNYCRFNNMKDLELVLSQAMEIAKRDCLDQKPEN
jgi:hypothetical protein